MPENHVRQVRATLPTFGYICTIAFRASIFNPRSRIAKRRAGPGGLLELPEA